MYNHPDLYEKAFSYRNLRRECNFLEKLFGNRVKSVLDIGCGLGGHLRILSERYSVSGLDKSRKMVEYARKKVKGNFYVRDMCAFSIPKKFDAAISMLATFSYIVNISEIYSHLDSVARSLGKKGIYVIEMGNPYVWFTVKRKTVLNSWETEGINVKMVQYPPDYMSQTVEWDVDICNKGKKIHSKNKSRIIFPQEFRDIIEKSGLFRVLGIYGDFSGKKFSKNSDRMVAVLQKL
jgi:SAM-dependent methyltransferase